MDFLVQPAEEVDLFDLHRLVNSAYRGDESRFGWTTEADLLAGQRTDLDFLRAYLSDPRALLLVGRLDGHLMASALLQKRGERAEIGMLTVQPRLQRGGIGQRILQFAESWAQKHFHAEWAELSVIHHRHELIAWYQRRGYILTGATQDFPIDNPRFGLPLVKDLHFVVMEKRLLF